jgi:PIN domain nuclease of toxin-antitoxin system
VKLLLDSSALLAVMFNPSILTPKAQTAVADPVNEVCVSAISPYELEWKKQIGKLTFAEVDDWDAALRAERIRILPLMTAHGLAAARLPVRHRDPWDRLIIAQALAENLTVVTSDRWFPAYGVSVLW